MMKVGVEAISKSLAPSTRLASGTATLAYALTSNLTARVEYRHDHISGSASDPFPQHGKGFGLDGGCQDDLDYGIFEVYYEFD